ncbi:MAG: hypothetical protein NTY39_06710 [Campylobacterales bacterium]|nr:hypothetical protein [Campylobacterales bacterium]
MSVTKKRRGFAMIMAIFIVLLVAAGGALLLSNTTIGAKGVSDAYLHTQAELLAESATEFAVMRAQGFNTAASGHCLENLNITINDASGSAMFDANVSMSYSSDASLVAKPVSCNNWVVLGPNVPPLPTMILVDVAVTDHNLTTEPIRVFKRSWQKL